VILPLQCAQGTREDMYCGTAILKCAHLRSSTNTDEIAVHPIRERFTYLPVMARMIGRYYKMFDAIVITRVLTRNPLVGHLLMIFDKSFGNFYSLRPICINIRNNRKVGACRGRYSVLMTYIFV
jgi:hypothetical protein